MNESIAMVIVGLVAGVLSGMFGIGGGLIIVPALVLLFGVDQKTAVGTSLFALLWPVGILGVREYWIRGELNITQGTMVALGLIFGVLAGAKLTGVLSPLTAKRFYAVFLLLIGMYMLYTTGSPPTAKVSAPAALPQTEGDQVH